MKAYTDLEQSHKLAEILPLESADHHYVRKTCDFMGNSVDGNFSSYETLPAWSLAALLDLLPNNEHISTTLSRGSWKIDTVEYLPNTWWCEYEDTKNQTEFNISADNPIDACYEMIIKLNELKML